MGESASLPAWIPGLAEPTLLSGDGFINRLIWSHIHYMCLEEGLRTYMFTYIYYMFGTRTYMSKPLT